MLGPDGKPLGWEDGRDGPAPILAGTFAIYEDGGGGFVLVTDVAGDVTRKHVPAAVVKLAMGEGAISRRVRAMMGG